MAKAEAQPQEVDPQHAELVRHLGAKRAEILSKATEYQPKTDPKNRPDVIENRYKIQLNRPLPELSTTLNKAYEVVDEQNATAPLYALVCNKELPQRIGIMPQLRNMNHPNLVAPIEATVIELSTGDQRLVLIFPRPPGVKLSTLITERKIPRGETYSRMVVLAPIVSILQQLEDNGICHGAIHPDNIFVHENKVMLGECVSEPCGYSQAFYAEPAERMQCAPAGKGDGEPSVDVYTLGILMMLLQPGRRSFLGLNPKDLHRKIQTQGAYNALIGEESLHEGILDLLRGCLHEQKRDRWTVSQLKVWASGKKFNVLMPSYPIEASRPYEFLGEGFLNRKALASALYGHWEQAAQEFRNGSVARWVELSVLQKDVGAFLHRVEKTCGGEKGVTITPKLNDELISRSLCVLDPYGPIRLRNLAVHVDGIGTMLAEQFRKNDEEEFGTFVEILEYDLANAWIDVMKRLLDQQISTNITNITWKLDRMRAVLKSKGLAFGLERLLYEINPYYPCQSPLFKTRHVTTLQQLVTALDHVAPQLAQNNIPMDRHIAAFIGSRMNIIKEVRIPELARNRVLATHPALVALKLLDQAQQKLGGVKLPGLSAWVASTLMPVLEYLHSKTLRGQVEAMLTSMATQGALRPMMELMQSQQYVAFDKFGFDDAIARFHDNRDAIFTLQNKAVLRAHSYQLGNKFAKFASYAALGGVLYFLSLQGKL